MTYKEFSEIWDDVLGEEPLATEMSPETETALIAYANGDTSYFDKVATILEEEPCV